MRLHILYISSKLWTQTYKAIVTTQPSTIPPPLRRIVSNRYLSILTSSTAIDQQQRLPLLSLGEIVNITRRSLHVAVVVGSVSVATSLYFCTGPIIDCCIIYVICRQHFCGAPHSSAPAHERWMYACACHLQNSELNDAQRITAQMHCRVPSSASTESGSAVGAASEEHQKATTTTIVPYFFASLLTFLISHILYFVHFCRRLVHVCVCMYSCVCLWGGRRMCCC